VARSTRQQRRQRRAQAPRPTSEEEPPRQPAEPRAERRDDVRPGVPGIRFLQESAAELRKVEWPSQQQVISGTAVVIIACLIVGVYLYGNDQLWSYVVKHILLR
jgi:preprotein translocase subunit SecE